MQLTAQQVFQVLFYVEVGKDWTSLVGRKISTRKTKVLCLSRNPRQFLLKWQHITASPEVQVPWCGIHKWQNKVSFIIVWSQNKR